MNEVFEWLDYVNEHKILRFVHLIVFFYVWFKFKATRLFGKIAIWYSRKTFLEHRLFENIETLTVQIPSHITNIGKKYAFTEFLSVESAMFVNSLEGFIMNMCKMKLTPDKDIAKSTPWGYMSQLIHYFYDFDYTTDSIPQRLLVRYEMLLKELPIIIENGHYMKIEVSQKQIIRWLKNNRETLVVTPEDSEKIREQIQRRYIRLMISKYESVMSDYRTQIKKNLALQITSELNMYDQLWAIFKYSFLSVYSAMAVSFPRKINEINGELKNIVYDGFDCGG